MFNMVPWKKKKEDSLTDFRQGMDSLFDRFYDDFFPPAGRGFDNFLSPSVDISEGRKKITVKAEMPGLDPKAIDVSLTGRFLTIKGEKKAEKTEKGENFHRVERSYGSFVRNITLPADVDESQVDATYKRGVLKIVLNKTKESGLNKIRVLTE